MRASGFFVYCGLAMLWAGVVGADTPVYDEQTGTLTVPVVGVDGQPGHFQDVVLEPAGDGHWRIASMDEGVLLDSEYVDSFGMASTGTSPVQRFVMLSGTFPNGCPEIGRITQRREGTTFRIQVYYAMNPWLRDPSVNCLDTVVPFEVSIPLDMYGLDAGQYSVRVNGHHLSTFTVEEGDTQLPYLPSLTGDDGDADEQVIEGEFIPQGTTD